jgi:hypothetical protein
VHLWIPSNRTPNQPAVIIPLLPNRKISEKRSVALLDFAASGGQNRRTMCKRSTVVMNSSRDTADHALARISLVEAKRFLIELVNLANDTDAANRFERRFERFLPWNCHDSNITTIKEIEFVRDPSSTVRIDMRFLQLFKLRDALRSIWVTNDMKTKEWQIFLFQADSTMTASYLAISGPPPPSPFQQSVLYLFKWATKTRGCSNRDCPSPYFFSQRSNQKYCSQDCALPIQRDYKRNWWRRHGSAWRKRRKNRSRRKIKH